MATEFKVGDRVAVYNSGQRLVGTISKLDCRKDLFSGSVAFSYGFNNESTLYVHPKQCRRLIKRKRIWLPLTITSMDVEEFRRRGWDWLQEVPGDSALRQRPDGWVEFLQVTRKKT